MTQNRIYMLLGLALTIAAAAKPAEAQFGFRLGPVKVGGGGASQGGFRKIPFTPNLQPTPSHSTLPYKPHVQPFVPPKPKTVPGFGPGLGGLLPKGPKTLPSPNPQVTPGGIGGVLDLFVPRTSPVTPDLPPGVVPLPSPQPKPPLIIVPGIVRPPFICPGAPGPPFVFPAPIVTPGPPIVTPLPAPVPGPPSTPSPHRPGNDSYVDADDSFADDAIGAQTKRRAEQRKLEQVADSAKQAMQKGDYDGALKLANRMTELAPKHGGVLQFRAAVYLGLTKYPEASIDAYNALLVGPIWTMRNVKDVYGSPRAYRRDVEWLAAATEQEPNVLAHQFLSGYHAMIANDWKTSEQHLNKMLVIQPGEPVATKLLEMARAKQGKAPSVEAHAATSN